MLGTIGYSKRTLEELVDRVSTADVLFDVRVTPYARFNPAFNKKKLEAALGSRYEWHGDKLGGKGAVIAPAALEWLAKRQKGCKIVLMCLEFEPQECHRFNTIAQPLFEIHGIDSLHLHKGNDDESLSFTSEMIGPENSTESYDLYEFHGWPGDLDE